MARRQPSDTTHYQLAEDKLALSGLSMQDAKVLKIEALSAAETASLHTSFKPLASLRFNYRGPYGHPLSDWPKAPPFYRLRYLETPNDFAKAAGKKAARYVQEPNTAPVAYYPQNQEWRPLLEDTGQPLIITEGELKAAAACQQGFPTIGLGGVYNWRSIKLGVTWIESLDFVTWLRRHVYICFDSDYRTNPQVCAALRDLADALHLRGSFVYIVSLPEVPGLDKTGLDDFLVWQGPNGPAALQDLLGQAEPLGLTRPLWHLNDNFVYVRDPGLVIDQHSHQRIGVPAFKDHSQAPVQYQERRLKDNGDVSYQAVSAAAAWLKWPLRKEVRKLVYSPGKESFVGDDFNIWPGWGVEPKEGDIEPFMQLIHHLFLDAEPEAKLWFLRWCACPLQYPGTKMFSSAVIHGIKHGTGKSLVGYTLGEIYGKNFTEISQRNLEGDFTEWAECKQFVMGDDVSGSDKRAQNDMLKKLITQKEIRINVKFVPSYTIVDCINYLFTANHPDSYFLEDDDRRFFIHEVVVGPLPEDFYMDYELWLKTGGAAAVFHYLLNLDMGGFNPAAPAFRTDAKQRMIENVRSDLAGWVRMLMENPDAVLRVGKVLIKKDLFTSTELLALYDPGNRTSVTPNGVGRELARAGFRQVCGGKAVRLKDGTMYRYYAVRNATKWLYDKGVEDIAEHLDNYNTKREVKY